MSDFDPATDAVPYEKLPAVDKYILGKLSQTVQEVESAYDSFQFSLANQELVSFATSDLSAFYLDVAKDRLYISTKNDERRRSCQTVSMSFLCISYRAIVVLTVHINVLNSSFKIGYRQSAGAVDCFDGTSDSPHGGRGVAEHSLPQISEVCTPHPSIEIYICCSIIT